MRVLYGDECLGYANVEISSQGGGLSASDRVPNLKPASNPTQIAVW